MRQSLPKSTKNTATRKTRTEGGENAAKAQDATPGIVTELRKNAEIPEKVEQFLASLKEGDASSPLHFLTGKGLVRILKSLDLPCFSGKGKAKQIDTLKNSSQVWKLSISSILKSMYHFLYITIFCILNVCSLAFPQALQEDIWVMC